MRWSGVPLLVLLLLSLGVPQAEAAERFWVSGGLGLGLGGGGDSFDLFGAFGYYVTPKFTPGVRGSYGSRTYDEVTTSDYGAAVFGRYWVRRPFYLHAEYEYRSYERVQAGSATGRDTFTGLLVGGGAGTKLGPHAFFYGSLLYNLSYDESEPGPYASPWIARVGLGWVF